MATILSFLSHQPLNLISDSRTNLLLLFGLELQTLSALVEVFGHLELLVEGLLLKNILDHPHVLLEDGLVLALLNF